MAQQSAFPDPRWNSMNGQNDYWHLLDQASAERRVIIINGTVQVEDLR